MKNKKKIIGNGIFLFLVLGLTLYGVFHGEDLGLIWENLKKADIRYLFPAVICVVFYLGRVDHHSLSALYVADPAEKMEVFPDFFRRFLFQLHHTVGKRRTADADGVSEKRKDSDLGILGGADDRNDHL